MNDKLLKDFIATAQKNNYNWNTVFDKFPELENYDKQLLKDYVATAEKNNYNYEVVNSKFPEFGFKKKSQAENGGSILGGGSSVSPKTEGDYTYGDSKSMYRKQGDKWLINNESTGGQYVDLKDPTGSRAKELNRNARKMSSLDIKSEQASKEISKTKDLSNVVEADSEIFTGYPGKEKNKYEFKDGSWYEPNPEVEKTIQRETEKRKSLVGTAYEKTIAINIKNAIKDIPKTRIIEDDARVKALNKQFGKNASLDADYETFGDYDNSPEKKDNKYRIKDNSWERLVPGATGWSSIENEGSISALNRRYGKNIDAKKAIIVKPKEIDPFLKVNTNFLAQSEESAQEMLEKNFKGMGFTFEQTGVGTDYITVTPNNGAKPMTFSFDEKSSDEAVKLQSYLRLNASAEKEDDLSAVNRIKNNVGIREKKYDLSPLEKNNEYYNTEDYKKTFKELTFQQKKEEIKRRVDENANLSASYGKGVLGDIYTSVFGEDEKYYKTERDLKKFKDKLKVSEEYKLFISEEKKYDEQLEEKYGKLYDELSIAKQSGNKEAIKTVKAKIGAGFSKEVIGDNLNNMTGHQYDLQRGINDFNKRKEKLELDAKNGTITQEQYNDGVEGLSSEAQRLDIAAKNVAATQKKMNALAGIYATEKAKSGGFFGNFTNSLLVGVDELISSDGLSGKKQRQQDKIEIESQDITPQQRQYYKDKGYNDEQIKNVFINNAQKNAIAANKRAIIETFGSDLTTEESKQNLSFFQQALVGVAASLPSMALSLIPVVGQAAAFGGMANMSYNAINEEMLNDTDFETTSEGDRAIVAIPYAVVMGALEKVGMNKMLKGESTIGKIVLSRIAKIIPKGATREVIENIANKEVKSLVAKGALKVIGGTLAEAETGALQAGLLDVGLKSLFNVLDPLDLKLTNKEGLTGGEAFETPDTKAGVAMSILEGSAAEAIGGFAMSTVMVGAQGLINGKISLYNEEDLKFFEDFSSDQEFKKLIVSKLKTEMLNGTMTKGEAQSALNDIDLVEGVFNSIDENLPEMAKLTAFNLINERNRLEKEKQGKDPALSKGITDRINEINDKLAALPKQVQRDNNINRINELESALKQRKNKAGTITIEGKKLPRVEAETELKQLNQKLKDAIQEQTAGQVPVQPTTAVGEEVVQGEPTAEPQVLTEEGKAEEVVPLTLEEELQIIADEKAIAPVIEAPTLEAPVIEAPVVETPTLEAPVVEAEATPKERVAAYRAEEQAELLKAIPKIESYKVKGKIDKTKMPKTVLAKYNKIYEKYNALISPLLPAVKTKTPVVKAPAVKAEAPKTEGKPTVMSWSKIEEYDDAVIRSMKEIQYGKLKPLLDLGKRTTIAQKEEIIAIQAKIATAERILGRRANKIKKEAQRVEKEGKGATVRAVDNNGTEAEYSIVVSKDGATAKVQLKKIGTLTPKRASVEANLTIQTDEKRGRFVITKNKTKVYIDEVITPAKVETTKAKVAPVVKAEPVKEEVKVEAPIVKPVVEAVVEAKAEPVKEAPAPAKVSTEDLMGAINSIKEDIKDTTEEIEKARAEAREKVNKIREEIIDLKESKGKEGTVMDLEADIKEIEDILKDDLDGLKLDLDRHVQALKEEVKKIEELDAKNPENKKTLISYLDAAIKTLNGLNKLTYAKLDAGVTLGTLKLILQGIRAGVIAGNTIKASIKAMASQYKGKHKNKKITIAEFTKEIEEYLRNTFVEQKKKTNEQDIQEARAKFVEIREAVRKAKLAVKTESKTLRANAENAIREMLKGKVKNLSAVQMKSIMLRLARFNVFSQTQYDKFINYVDKVIGIADYDAKVNEANKNRKNAKKNTIGNKPKLGDITPDLFRSLSIMLNIDAKLIPSDVFESYSKIVEMLSKRDTVLQLEQRSFLNENVDKIIASIELNDEKISDLKELYDNFEKVKEDGKVDYSGTLAKMLKDDIINQDEHDLMKTFKSKIVEAKVKDKMTEQEIADEKAELIDEINNTTITLDEIVGDEFRLERELAKRLQVLLKQTDFQNLKNKDLKKLLIIIDNINNGFVSNATQLMVEKLNSTKKSIPLATAVHAKITSLYNKMNRFISKTFSRDEFGIAVAPLNLIDEQFGDFETKNIYNSIFKDSAKAQQAFEAEISKIRAELIEIEKSLDKFFGKDRNKKVASKIKMMIYMLQIEKNSNPNSNKVHNAIDILDATIKFSKENSKKSKNSKADLKVLESIRENFAKDEQIDMVKLFSSFGVQEKNALKKLQEINNSMTKKAAYTATVINGNKITTFDNYIFHNTISASDDISVDALVNSISDNMQPTTKSKNLEERGDKALAMNLNPFLAVTVSSRSVLLNYHLTEPIRTARKTLIDTIKLLDEEKANGEKKEMTLEERKAFEAATKEQYDILNAIKDAYETATKDLLTSNFTESRQLIEWLSRQGYRAVLASAPRAVAEITSNALFVFSAFPKEITIGFNSNFSLSNSSDAKNILEFLGSSLISRLYPEDSLSSVWLDTSAFANRISRDGKMRPKMVNGVLKFHDKYTGRWVDAVSFMADNLIAKPDQAIMRPLWFGSFVNSFKNKTGVEPDFNKIKENDEAYMDEYRDALEEARDVADNNADLTGGNMNPYMSSLQNVIRKEDSFPKVWLKTFQKYMNKFTVKEYYTARKGVRALVGDGDITQKQGALILTGVALRMTMYTTITRLLSEFIMYSFGLGDDDGEEDDDYNAKHIGRKLYQGFTSMLTTLILGRRFGNVVRMAENYFIERANEAYGEDIGLRNGEYDPYEDAIQFNQLQDGKIDKTTDLVKVIAGPYAPAIGFSDLVIKKTRELGEPEAKTERARITKAKEWGRLGLETTGFLGIMPLYKDVRKVFMGYTYKELKEETKKAAVNKESQAKADAEEIVQKTSILKQMMNSGGYTREGIKKELRKIKDPEYRKAENKIEEDMLKSILDKTKYSSRTDFEEREKENAKNAFKLYDKKREESLKINRELKNRMKALKYGEQYVPKKKKASGTFGGSDSFGGSSSFGGSDSFGGGDSFGGSDSFGD